MGLALLEKLQQLPKDADIDIEECNILGKTTELNDVSLQFDSDYGISVKDNGTFNAVIGEKDGHYYMFEFNGITGADTVREIALYNKYGNIMNFDYTPDDLHDFYVAINTEKGTVFKPEVREMDISLIKDGMSCSYNGISLTVEDKEHVTISAGDYEKTYKVEEDREFTYKFLKSKIKAKEGAYGYYAFMEQIAAQSQIEPYPLFSAAFSKQAEALENSLGIEIDR